jgi:fused signal recognition particle receptor
VTGVLSRWNAGLRTTSQKAFGRLTQVLGVTEISRDTWDELESLLIQADVGTQTTQEILGNLQRTAYEQGLVHARDLRLALRHQLLDHLIRPPLTEWTKGTHVLLVVGVNGSGKTTTIAKLTRFFQAQGKRVLLGAADTFRAAATEQLQLWANSLGVEIVTGAADSDPGAVAFNAVKSGVARAADVVIIDTAGRLHTRSNLMDELRKVCRVVGKAQDGAPHAVWLVLDAMAGQNALVQARAFKEAVGVTGIVLAKLDTSARGGMAFAIQKELALPILFAGLGERAEDLAIFEPESFVDGILETAKGADAGSA